ncbi:hypothetical protein XAC2852_1270032 [Xanthomonas citri pv. citri]|nr:hypothetical protein XAC902_1560032 [Xanthomonas citri pv. citri]CEE56562.1 hypothetical protein XAC2852_1270032 [Xanthomonas citri pv. citri]
MGCLQLHHGARGGAYIQAHHEVLVLVLHIECRAYGRCLSKQHRRHGSLNAERRCCRNVARQ